MKYSLQRSRAQRWVSFVSLSMQSLQHHWMHIVMTKKRGAMCKDCLAVATAKESVNGSQLMEDWRVGIRCVGRNVWHTHVLYLPMFSLGKLVAAMLLWER